MAKIPKIGQKIRVRLSNGKEVQSVVRGVLTSNSGPRIKIEHGTENLQATINLDQIVWPIPSRTATNR